MTGQNSVKYLFFLLTVRQYILKQAKDIDVSSKNGYYHHLKEAINKSKFEISQIATTNYNNFISEITNCNIMYLNGSTSLCYDPYLNKIIDDLDKDDMPKHFYLPLMFTQSGTKPMTSIEMSIKYVETYRAWKKSDAIVSIGFGFNADDEHINGISRTLVDVDGKKLIVVTLANGKSEEDHSKEIREKLKISSENNVKIVFTDGKSENDNWIDDILNTDLK